jgi:hypothetical protein
MKVAGSATSTRWRFKVTAGRLGFVALCEAVDYLMNCFT